MTKPLLHFFAALAAAGLALSVLSHAAALAGISGPLGGYTFVLHVGVFVVWIPAVLASNRLTRNVSRKDFWKGALRGCPDWMKYMTYAFLGYALLNFLVFAVGAPSSKFKLGVPNGSSASSLTPEAVRGFSGHWMAFYSAAFALLYSAANLWERDVENHCPNGHAVQPLAKFCDQCGLPIAGPPEPNR